MRVCTCAQRMVTAICVYVCVGMEMVCDVCACTSIPQRALTYAQELTKISCDAEIGIGTISKRVGGLE